MSEQGVLRVLLPNSVTLCVLTSNKVVMDVEIGRTTNFQGRTILAGL